MGHRHHGRTGAQAAGVQVDGLCESLPKKGALDKAAVAH